MHLNSVWMVLKIMKLSNSVTPCLSNLSCTSLTITLDLKSCNTCLMKMGKGKKLHATCHLRTFVFNA